MSLTVNDLQQIEAIFDKKLPPVMSKLETLESDIKEIYKILSDLQQSVFTDSHFEKLSLNQKLLALNAELLSAAKQAGISLPRA